MTTRPSASGGVSRRHFVSTAAAWWLPLSGIDAAFAQTSVASSLELVGLAHAAALTQRPISALGGTLFSLLEARTQQALPAAHPRAWTVEDVKQSAKDLSDLTSAANQEILNSCRKASGITDLGMVSPQGASTIVNATILLGSETLRAYTAGVPVPRLPPALESAVTGPAIRASLAVLDSSAGKLDTVVAAFAKAESPISLKVDPLAAIEYLPESSRAVLSGILNNKADVGEKLAALISEQLKVNGKSLASDIVKIRSVANEAGDLAGMLSQKSGDLQVYTTSLNVAAGIVESIGGKGIAKDMRNAASIMQQSYTVYQLFAAGTMGPLGAMAHRITHKSPSPERTERRGQRY